MRKIHIILIALVSGAIFLFVMQTNSLVAGELEYVGNKKCMGCHRNEYKAWQQDYHAMALDDLKPGVKAEAKTKANLDPDKDYSTDASCLGCHSTGYGKPAVEGAKLENVGCESCHGPASQYRKPKIMSKKKYKENPEAQHKLAIEAGLIEPTEKVCLECHNDKSPTWKGFDYKKTIEEVNHKK